MVVILLVTLAVDKTGFLLTDDLEELLYVDGEEKDSKPKAESKEQEPNKNVKVKSEKKNKFDKSKFKSNKSSKNNSDYLDVDLSSLETSDSSVEEDAATMLEDIYK